MKSITYIFSHHSRTALLFLSSLLILLFSPTWAVTSSTNNNSNNTANIGIYAKNLNTKQTLMTQHIDWYYAPASTLKLFIATASLLQLGPDFRYQTILAFNPTQQQQQNLIGDVLIKFSGDPAFTHEDLFALLTQLKQAGITRIQGNIVLDNNAFDQHWFADGWAQDQLHICYAGPVSAINIDHNCMLFYLWPNKTPGHTAKITIEKKAEKKAEKKLAYKIHNTVVTTESNQLKLKPKLTIQYNQNTTQFDLSGTITQDHKPMRFTLAIPDPIDYAKRLINKQLTQLNIRLTGKIISTNNNTNTNAKLKQFVHQSPPLQQLIQIMLKNSDNLIANSLLKTLGQQATQQTGSWANGIASEKKILANTMGFIPDQLYIYDGAGISFYDFITPKQLMRLLNYIDQHDALAKVIIPALPVGHTDGTLKTRFPTLGNTIQAKTGSRRDVSALAGYVTNADGSRSAIVILINNNQIEQAKKNNQLIRQIITKIKN